MIKNVSGRGAPVSARDLARRKTFLGATIVTCVVLTFLGATVHVLQLGANRMHDMRGKATYDESQVSTHLRAAGEEFYRHVKSEYMPSNGAAYTIQEAESLLKPEQWQDVATTVVIPAGEFVMGTNSGRADPQDKPEHTVVLPAFKMDKYLVTNAQYARFVAETGRRPPLAWINGKIPAGKELHPVTMVSWFDARAYAQWAGKRLPTEQEWERAARGTDGRRWPWGDKMEPLRLNTYYHVGGTTPVGAYPNGASPEGLLDMAGNVSQWVEDEFLPYGGSDAPANIFVAKVAELPVSASERSMKIAEFAETQEHYRVLRGGSWKSDPFSTASYHRNFAWPQMASDFFGFRCVQDVGG